MPLSSDEKLIASRRLLSVPQSLGLSRYMTILCDSIQFDPSPYAELYSMLAVAITGIVLAGPRFCEKKWDSRSRLALLIAFLATPALNGVSALRHLRRLKGPPQNPERNTERLAKHRHCSQNREGGEQTAQACAKALITSTIAALKRLRLIFRCRISDRPDTESRS
jgi:hypothetical protein